MSAFDRLQSVEIVQLKCACHRTTARRATRRKRRAPEAGRLGRIRLPSAANNMAHQKSIHPTIRRARPDDALCLGVLATQVFLDTYATEGVRSAIANEVLTAFSTSAMAAQLERRQTRVLVAEYIGHLIGFAQITVGTAIDLVASAAPAELDRLYVQEPFAGKGVGSTLLQEAEALSVSAGATDLWLTPWVKNDRALRFFKKHAYVDLGATYFHMEGEKHENRVLSKHLPR
jgi:GNAT superfamily N-acetyltransferase